MLSEDPIYEKLNETNNAQDFITETVSIFEDAVDHLINRVFRKTDFVVKSVVESLFETSGPLSDLAIRLKVLLGLGVINHQVFEDIQAFLRMQETLSEQDTLALADNRMVDFALSLHLLEYKNLTYFAETKEEPTSLVYQMKQLRHEKLLRSSLILTVSAIYQQLVVESPFN